MHHTNWWNNNRWYWEFRFSHANVQFNRCTSNYSETTGSFWFFSKDEATNFNADITNNKYFTSILYNAKLLENTAADKGDNEI